MTDAQKKAAVQVAVSQYDGGDLTVCKEHLEVIPGQNGCYVKAWIFIHEDEIQARLED
jgi:hypothetical protein